MFTIHAPVLRHGKSTQATRRVSAIVSALVSVLLLAGNVAAVQLAGDDNRTTPIVTPKLETRIADLHLRFKLATKAGYEILVRF
jgi:hypothetical protein